MYYSYRQCPIKVNGNVVYASEASLSCQNDLSTTFKATERHSFNYVPGGPLQGSFKFSYYLTGNDPIKDLILQERIPTSGYFGGIEFSGGYLKSYSLNASPNSPAVVNSEIVFFDQPNGSFSPSSYSATNVPCLVFSDATFSGQSTDTINVAGSSISNFSYNFQSNLKPVYRQQDITPYRISFREKNISSEIVFDNLDQSISISGAAADFKVTLNNPANPSDFEFYQINGSVTQKSISASVDQPIRQSVSVKQDFADLPPTLGVFYPASGYPDEGILVYGENLENIIDVQFGGAPGYLTQSELNGTALTTRIPYDAISGPIKVTTYGGVAYTTDSFLINDPGIQVYNVSPITGSVGDFVNISGENFYRISNVTFGGTGSSFTRIDNSSIQAVVPNYATYGYVNVISAQRNQTGTYHSKFVPIPQIDSFAPPYGITGVNVYLQGQGFSGVTGVTFNNIQAGFSVTSNTALTAYVPSGNVLGYIRVNGYSGVTARTPNYFYPDVQIDSLIPSTVYTGYQLLISGTNFLPEIMYNTIGSKYLIRFATSTGEFTRLNNSILSGYVPSGTLSGPVQIYNRQGSAFEDYENLTVRYPAPIITSFAPASGRTGDLLVGYGQNLFSLTGVNFTAAIASSTRYQSLSYSNNTAGTMFSAVVPNAPTGYYYLRAENTEGTGLASTNYLINTPYVYASTASGFAGLNSGIANTLSFGHYSSAPATTNDYIKNETSFDLNLVFPGVSGYDFGAGLNMPRTVLAVAGTNQNVNLYIPTTLRFGNITGTWFSTDGATGSFISSVF